VLVLVLMRCFGFQTAEWRGLRVRVVVVV
jgi:hypothetical protein